VSNFAKGIHSRYARSWAAIVILSGAFGLAPAAPALAFTSGPHTEMVEDSLAAEGFGNDAIAVAGIDNTFMDFYGWVAASVNPYAGQGSVAGRFIVQNLSTESWPNALVASATRSHFDNNPGGPHLGEMNNLGTTAGVTDEWNRLRRSVWTLMQEARAEDNPLKGLIVIGMSTHQVQDFYAHTNWDEPPSGMGADGPGWQERGYGTYPTWFDVPAGEREKFTLYGDSTPGHSRTHGYWSTDGNVSLATAMNKDSPPRPFYLKAAISAYFATRQWVEAIHSWVGDAFWERMQSYRAEGERGKELDYDRKGLFNIMLYAGRWEGQGEPLGGPSENGAAGNLLSLRSAIKNYFEPSFPRVRGWTKTSYRKAFERLVLRMAEPDPSGQLAPVPSSQPLQEKMWVVVLRINKMASVGTFGLGDPWPDQADMYAQIRIDGQMYHSDVIHGRNEFNFGNPYEPFTKYKVVPKDTVEREPLESVEVEVKTGDERWAGTDDDIYLRLGERRFPLDKRGQQDFERHDRDTYSVPIDDAVRDGMRVGDIYMVKIEKDPDGLAGGWELDGVKLQVNGRLVYDNQGIHTWLGDNHLSWEARNFVRRNPRGAFIPIWLQLREDDDYYGSDDDGDINPDDRRDTVSLAYVLGKKVSGTVRGANRLGGRVGYGGDLASLTYSVETLTPELISVGAPGLPAPSGPPSREAPAPAGIPDLVITDLGPTGVTVKNQGTGAAGPFRLRALTSTNESTPLFRGLAAGASETQRLGLLPCEFVEAIVDDLDQVEETNETNNRADTASLEEIC
jgi:hypothetical protein